MKDHLPPSLTHSLDSLPKHGQRDMTLTIESKSPGKLRRTTHLLLKTVSIDC